MCDILQTPRFCFTGMFIWLNFAENVLSQVVDCMINRYEKSSLMADLCI